MRWKWFTPGKHFLLMVAQEMLPTWGTHSNNSCIALLPGSPHAYWKWRYDKFLVCYHFHCDCVHLTGVLTWMGTPWGLPSPAPCALRGPLSDSRRTGGGQSAVPEAPLPTSWDISSTWVMMKTLVSVNSRLEHWLSVSGFLQIYKIHDKIKMESLGCYIASPAYKASLLPSVLLSVEQNELEC